MEVILLEDVKSLGKREKLLRLMTVMPEILFCLKS